MATQTTEIVRADQRSPEQLRPLEIIPNAMPYAEGSALIKLGGTHVLCAASVDDRVPRWMANKGRGWVTAEYSMLPRATKERTNREAASGKQGGRTIEIQRLIGRALRTVVDLDGLGERQIILDCDVLQADGGTRCASITGAYVALSLALRKLAAQRKLKKIPLKGAVAAVSVGIVGGVPMLDLDYSEDAVADVDFNVVMTDAHAFIELQGTAEREPFLPGTLDDLLVLASTGIDQLIAAQRAVLESE